MQARVRRRDPSAGTRTGGIPGWALAERRGVGPAGADVEAGSRLDHCLRIALLEGTKKIMHSFR